MTHDKRPHHADNPDHASDDTLEAYFDGELTHSGENANWEERVRRDPDLRDELHALHALRTRLRRLPRAEAPPYLRAQIVQAASSQSNRSRKKRIAYAGAGLAVAMAIGLGLALLFANTARDDTFAPIHAKMVTDHVTYTPKPSETFVAGAAEAPALETWFAERLGFVPDIPRWDDWATLRSGRLCSLDGRRVAFLRYECGEEPMSLFIWPAAGESATEANLPPRILTSPDGFIIARWSKGTCEYGLVTAPGLAAEERLAL